MILVTCSKEEFSYGSLLKTPWTQANLSKPIAFQIFSSKITNKPDTYLMNLKHTLALPIKCGVLATYLQNTEDNNEWLKTIDG